LTILGEELRFEPLDLQQRSGVAAELPADLGPVLGASVYGHGRSSRNSLSPSFSSPAWPAVEWLPGPPIAAGRWANRPNRAPKVAVVKANNGLRITCCEKARQ
jgi:hypothetical protein